MAHDQSEDAVVKKANIRIHRHTFYRHYKGSTYRVLVVASSESDLAPQVVYENIDGLVFSRPFSAWEELVDHDGRFIQRFVRLPEHVEPAYWPPRDDFEKHATPETKLRKELKEAYDTVKAQEDEDFLKTLRDMSTQIPIPRISMKDAATKLGIDYDELTALFEADASSHASDGKYVMPKYASGNWRVGAAAVGNAERADAIKANPLVGRFELMLKTSQRFADFCSLSSGELPIPYESYIASRYPTELAYTKAWAESQGFENCINWRMCDPEDSQDYELYLMMNTASTPATHVEFSMEVRQDTFNGTKKRLLGFAYTRQFTNNKERVEVPSLTFSNVEVISEKVPRTN